MIAVLDHNHNVNREQVSITEILLDFAQTEVNNTQNTEKIQYFSQLSYFSAVFLNFCGLTSLNGLDIFQKCVHSCSFIHSAIAYMRRVTSSRYLKLLISNQIKDLWQNQ